MAASRKPQPPDEPTVREAQALASPAERSTGRGRRLSGETRRVSGQHHEVTGSGPALPQPVDPKGRPPAKHAVPSEVTAGRGLALKLSSGEEITARGAAVQEAHGDEAKRVASLAAATAEASRTAAGPRQSVDSHAETQDRLSPVPDEPPSEDDADDEELPGAPPDADEVALRALAVAALLQRAAHEARPSNASEVRQLQGWVDAFGLYASFGAGAFELFDTPHGGWAPEDRAAVAWLSEELRLLLWALQLDPGLPSTFERSDAKALVKKVPLLEPPQPFVTKAKLRGLDELEVLRAYYDVVQEAAHCEAWARAILDEPSLADEQADELEDVLASAEGEGFPRAKVEAKDGKAAAAVGALRAWSRALLQNLFESGSPHAALAFDPGALEAMETAKLANALATAQTRARALEWLTEGDEWDVDEDEDDGEAAEEDAGSQA